MKDTRVTPRGRKFWIDNQEERVIYILPKFDGDKEPPPMKLTDSEEFHLFGMTDAAWDTLIDIIQSVYTEGFNTGFRNSQERVTVGIENILGVEFKRR